MNDERYDAMSALDVLVGEWDMSSSLAAGAELPPRARVSFEWLPGKRFLIQRWEIDLPEAPDGIAIIGIDSEGTGLLQHYFDSRGTERLYQMTFDGSVWTLQRAASAPDFSQRFISKLSQDHQKIDGQWEISHDGSDWEHDFELNYVRIRQIP